jgi:hypothetical protein
MGLPRQRYRSGSPSVRRRTSYDALQFPAKGAQYNSAHPPLYYVVTGLAARAGSAVTGRGFLGVARILGVAWLTTGLWLLLAALRRLCMSWTLATSVTALVALAPGHMHASSTVTNDAAAVLAGALALWVTLRLLQGASSWLAFAAVGSVVVSLKFIFALALVPGGVALLLQLLRVPEDRPRLLRALTAGVTGAATTVAGWTLNHASRGSSMSENPVLGINTREAEGILFGATTANLLAGWPPVSQHFLQTGLEEPQVALWAALVTLLLGSAPLMGLAARRSVIACDLSLGAIIGLLSMPVFVELHTYATYGHYFPAVSPRYGLALVPALALALATTVRGRAMENFAVILVILGAMGVITGVATG